MKKKKIVYYSYLLNREKNLDYAIQPGVKLHRTKKSAVRARKEDTEFPSSPKIRAGALIKVTLETVLG